VLFQNLRARGVIDGYLNLGQRFVDQGLDYPRLACPGDGHFCADGLAWAAGEILREFSPWLGR
jgi:hypothetical protein